LETRIEVSKPRGISADFQSPRVRLLYFIYSAPGSKIKAEPGVKSNICSALGYKSDGHFHYDWNYLLNAGMIEEKQGYFVVTEQGKKEFALHSTSSRSNTIMILFGVAVLLLNLGLELKLVPSITVGFFGAVLIVIGALFLLLGKRNMPELPLEARVLLKELKSR